MNQLAFYGMKYRKIRLACQTNHNIAVQRIRLSGRLASMIYEKFFAGLKNANIRQERTLYKAVRKNFTKMPPGL